jgi:GntR family transcriptional regulator
LAKPTSSEVRARLRKFIESENAPGDRLPSEQQLAKDLGVSRNTVREVLEEFQTLGVVQRRWGHGTFVSASIHGLQKWLNELTPIPEVVRGAGMDPKLVRYEFEQASLPGDMRRSGMSFDPEYVWRLERLYSADRTPFIHLVDFIPVEKNGHRLDPAKFRERIWDLLSVQLGEAFSYANAEIEAVPAPRNIADQLKVRAGSPLVRDRQFLCSTRDQIVACTETHIRTDVISLKVKRQYRPALHSLSGREIG